MRRKRSPRVFDWWRPEILAEFEQRARTGDPNEASTATDFGAYRRILAGEDLASAGLALHNDLDPGTKVELVARRAGLLRGSAPAAVLDAGCGAGYTTAALARLFPSARVTGVDISHDAVAYARATHPGADFRAEAISPSSPPEGTFDAVFCFEFYPFTRNDDADAQSEYLRMFASRLTPGGRIVVYQTWRNPNSLGAVYREVRAALPDLAFRKRLTAHPRLAARLPMALAWAASCAGTVLARRDWLKPIVVVTRRGG